MNQEQKKDIMVKILNKMIKNYKYIKIDYGLVSENIMIIRNHKHRLFKAFYHFDFKNFEIHTSYWNYNKKKWNDCDIKI